MLRTWRLLAGLQAGVAAAAIMAAYLLFENVLVEASPWYAPNLFASTLLGRQALRAGFGAATLVGYSFLMVLAGGKGLLFGLLVPPGVGVMWSANIGVAYALASYLLVFRLVLGAWNPWLLAGFSRAALLVAFFLFGAALGSYPRFYRRISRPLPPANVVRMPDPNA